MLPTLQTTKPQSVIKLEKPTHPAHLKRVFVEQLKKPLYSQQFVHIMPVRVRHHLIQIRNKAVSCLCEQFSILLPYNYPSLQNKSRYGLLLRFLDIYFRNVQCSMFNVQSSMFNVQSKQSSKYYPSSPLTASISFMSLPPSSSVIFDSSP